MRRCIWAQCSACVDWFNYVGLELRSASGCCCLTALALLSEVEKHCDLLSKHLNTRASEGLHRTKHFIHSIG